MEKKAATALPMRAAPVQRNRAIRENCLIGTLNAGDALKRDIGELARLLRVLSGMYDQAMRSAVLRSLVIGKKGCGAYL
jgi:predicted MarR family transcription regulator